MTSHIRALRVALDSATDVKVLLTHAHGDHAGGAVALARLCNASLLATESFRAPASGPPDLRFLQVGDRIGTDQGSLVTVGIPGHTRDHVAFHWEETDALFVGDLLLGRGSTTWIGEYLGCVEDYLRSLDRVTRLNPSILYPGHGPPITDTEATLDRFRRHRLERLKEVAEARRRSPEATPEALATLVYGEKIPASLRRAAVRSITAALYHLEGQGGVGA